MHIITDATGAPRRLTARIGWFVGLWAVSAAATVAVAYGLRLIMFGALLGH